MAFQYRAPDKVHTFNSIMLISSPNPMFDHSLESSHWDDSNKLSNIGFGEEMSIIQIKISTLSGALIRDHISAKYLDGDNIFANFERKKKKY